MRVVLDSSMALTWCLPNQFNTASQKMLESVKMEGALVPAIWHLEMANILGLKLRDRNISEKMLSDALHLLNLLDVRTDATPASDRVANLIGHIIRFDLAAYDALYVELALRSGLSLATFDRAMMASAKRFGIPVSGPA